jgi:hypothetical protein
MVSISMECIRIKYYIHSSFKKCFGGKSSPTFHQYFKDRKFLMSKCIQKQENEYNLINVQNWIQLLASVQLY